MQEYLDMTRSNLTDEKYVPISLNNFTLINYYMVCYFYIVSTFMRRYFINVTYDMILFTNLRVVWSYTFIRLSINRAMITTKGFFNIYISFDRINYFYYRFFSSDIPICTYFLWYYFMCMSGVKLHEYCTVHLVNEAYT